jgi:Na+(H+)/acetate symporter ActP
MIGYITLGSVSAVGIFTVLAVVAALMLFMACANTRDSHLNWIQTGICAPARIFVGTFQAVVPSMMPEG